MYEGATSFVQINGPTYGPIPIRCAVRQACPMTMATYDLSLYPFHHLLDLKLPSIRLGHRSRPTSVVAYSDDVNIFVTSVVGFIIIDESIHLYERAFGARISSRKSKSLAAGSWCTQETALGIVYNPSVTIVSVTF